MKYSDIAELRELKQRIITQVAELTPAQSAEVYKNMGKDPSTAKYVVLPKADIVVNTALVRTQVSDIDEIIMSYLPDLYHARKNLDTEFTFQIKTMATCPGHLFINPLFYDELDKIDPLFAPLAVVIHEVYHNLFRHFDRAEANKEKFNQSVPEIRDRCNRAMDYEINPLVEHCGIVEMIGIIKRIGGLIDERFFNVFWEEIYDLLVEEDKKNPPKDNSMFHPEDQPQQQGGSNQNGGSQQQSGGSQQGGDQSQGGESQSGQSQGSQSSQSQGSQGGQQSQGGSQGAGQPQGGQQGGGQQGEQGTPGEGSQEGEGDPSDSQSGSEGGKGDQSKQSDGEQMSDSEFSNLSESEQKDAIRNSSRTLSDEQTTFGTQQAVADPNAEEEHIMSEDKGRQINKNDGREANSRSAKGERNDAKMRDLLKDRSYMRRVYDEPMKRSLREKGLSTSPGNGTGDKLAQVSLVDKRPKMKWTDILENLFGKVRPSFNKKREVNRYQISTYRSIARKYGNGSRTIVPMRGRKNVNPAGAVWVFVDTSGSMFNYLANSITMIADLASQNIDNLSGLVIIPIDTQIADIQIWDYTALDEIKTIYDDESTEELPMHFGGGGGTYFDTAIKFLDECVYDYSLDDDDISNDYFGGKPLSDVVIYFDEDNFADGGEHIDNPEALLREMPPCATLLLTDSDVQSGALSEEAIRNISNIDEEFFYTFIFGRSTGDPIKFGQTVLVPEINGAIKIAGRMGEAVPEEEL